MERREEFETYVVIFYLFILRKFAQLFGSMYVYTHVQFEDELVYNYRKRINDFLLTFTICLCAVFNRSELSWEFRKKEVSWSVEFTRTRVEMIKYMREVGNQCGAQTCRWTFLSTQNFLL
jgi:hypothetical protein